PPLFRNVNASAGFYAAANIFRKAVISLSKTQDVQKRKPFSSAQGGDFSEPTGPQGNRPRPLRPSDDRLRGGFKRLFALFPPAPLVHCSPPLPWGRQGL